MLSSDVRTAEPIKRPYHAMIGTGGVGSGTFFALDGNHTLGREESRAGRYLDRHDYCKLHIISHYTKALLGRDFAVIPASKVGADETGRHLLEEMEAAGLDTRYMQVDEDRPTLFSFCYTYPDGSGGNLTTSNAATAAVDPEFIDELKDEFFRWNGRAVALAAPEVPMAARQRLLQLGTLTSCLRVAALTTGESQTEAARAILKNVDLLAVNAEEAATLAGAPTDLPPADILGLTVQRVRAINPGLRISLTAGEAGSWCWDGSAVAHTPIFPVDLVSAAGAGDAHLAGVITGLVTGLELPRAQQLGALVAACAITSPHTIHKGLNRGSLKDLAARRQFQLDPQVRALLAEG